MNEIQPVSIEGTCIILEQMKNCICKIYKKDGEIGSGFFCKIRYGEKLLPVLITNNHILNKYEIQENNIIYISLNDGKEFREIKIDNSRIKYTSEEYDTTIIEIKSKDNINNFLEIDENIYKNQEFIEEIYYKKSIYILHYPRGEKIFVSYGLIKNFSDKKINYCCDTEEGSSGAPILSLKTFKVIGIHFGAYRKLKINKGILISIPYNQFNNIIPNNFNNSNNNINFITIIQIII